MAHIHTREKGGGFKRLYGYHTAVKKRKRTPAIGCKLEKTKFETIQKINKLLDLSK